MGASWGISTDGEVYELMSLEQFYKLCSPDLKSWLIDKNPREVCVGEKLADHVTR